MDASGGWTQSKANLCEPRDNVVEDEEEEEDESAVDEEAFEGERPPFSLSTTTQGFADGRRRTTTRMASLVADMRR